MKIHFLILLFIVALTVPVWARLGETEDQLIARYGREVGSKLVTANGKSELITFTDLAFTKTGYSIEVILFHGVSAEELIFKTSQDKMAEDEIQTLLQINAQGQTWTIVPGPVLWPEDNGTIRPHQGRMWRRDDGAVATVSDSRDGFVIKAKSLIDAEADANKAAHGTSLDGF